MRESDLNPTTFETESVELLQELEDTQKFLGQYGQLIGSGVQLLGNIKKSPQNVIGNFANLRAYQSNLNDFAGKLPNTVFSTKTGTKYEFDSKVTNPLFERGDRAYNAIKALAKYVYPEELQQQLGYINELQVLSNCN